MDVTVIVAASTTSTRDTLEHATVGALADAVAQTHAVAGDIFTLKIDGAPTARSALVEDVIHTAEIMAVELDEPVLRVCDSIIELIEITTEQEATLEDPDPTLDVDEPSLETATSDAPAAQPGDDTSTDTGDDAAPPAD